MKFLSLKPEAFGLDISDLCLRIAKLKKTRHGLNLTSWREMAIPPGIIKEGEIVDEEKMIKALKELTAKVNGEKIKTKHVIVCLPERKAFLQVIKFPKMKPEELITAVPFEAENYIPLAIEDVYLDFQILPVSKGANLNVLIAAVPKEVIDPYVLCLGRAGLVPKALEVESQSIARALIRNQLSAFPLLIIDFGASTTSFIIFSGHSLRFTSSINVSSFQLTQALARSLKIELKQAEALKIKDGLNNKENVKAISPLLKDLTKQSRKYIDYYRDHANGDAGIIKKVLLCGKGSNLKGLPEFISAELKLPTELANPWINILPKRVKKVPKLPFQESLGYTTALGLALRDIYD